MEEHRIGLWKSRLAEPDIWLWVLHIFWVQKSNHRTAESHIDTWFPCPNTNVYHFRWRLRICSEVSGITMGSRKSEMWCKLFLFLSFIHITCTMTSIFMVGSNHSFVHLGLHNPFWHHFRRAYIEQQTGTPCLQLVPRLEESERCSFLWAVYRRRVKWVFDWFGQCKVSCVWQALTIL